MPNTLSSLTITGITLTASGADQSPFTITSTGTIAPAANLTGSGTDGVYGSAASGLTLINQGIINGGDSGKTGGTGGTGVYLSGVSGFSNSGTITGGSATGNAGFGVVLTGTGSFSNTGIISGGTGHGGTALQLYGTGTFTNQGSIEGGLGSNLGALGVYLDGGELINAGLIAAGGAATPSPLYAVYFGTHASTLIVESGARFQGSVSANATVSDVLAIGGTTAVDLSGIGTQFTGFHALAFEPGSTGTFAGSLSGLNNDFVDGFARGDGFYLNGFTASTPLATINAGGILALTGNTPGQTLDLFFSSAATGDVLSLTTETNGTSISIDPHILNQSIATGVTLTPGGAYQSAFTITSAGTVAPTQRGANGVSDGKSPNPTLINHGVIMGASTTQPRGLGGSGVYFYGSGNFSNTGTIIGGSGPTAGPGAAFFSAGTLSNSGTILGGNGSAAGAGVLLLGASTFDNTGIITAGIGSAGGSGGVGVYLMSAGSFDNSGTITGGSGGTGNSGGVGIYITSGGSFSNSGTLIGGQGSTYAGAGAYLIRGTLTNAGLIAGGLNGSGSRADAIKFGTHASSLIVESGATFQGNVVANISAPDTLAIGGTTAVSLSGIGTEFQNFSALAFDPGATGTITGTYTAMENLNITSFAQGDTLILDGFAATSDTYVSNVGLELSNGTNTITLDITGSFSTANFNVIDPPTNTTISLNPPCFAAGTRILTTRGEIPVENLTLNDHVILDSGTTAPIQWLGFRSLSPNRHPNPEQVSPIHIQAGALADNIPHRDLIVSPDHALYLDGALIPAKALLNGTTIRQINVTSITYYHVELPTHAILLAEGTPTESYLETGNRHAFTNADSLPLILHPNLAQTRRERESCAPFTESGPLVEAVRAQILARTNQTFTTDPALTLQTNPDGSVAIISRSAIPGQLNADPRDQRRLGVKIASLEIGGETIALDHPLLTEGWHTTEPDGRWTNGRSVIPAELVRGEKIILAPAATLAYPADQRTSQHAA